MKVGLAGLGAIGLPVARKLLSAKSGILGLSLAGVCVRDAEKARTQLTPLGGGDVPVLSAEDLAATCDVVVECAAPAAFETIAWPAVRAGKTLLVLTATRLLANLEAMQAEAAKTGSHIIVPTGALAGLDAVRAVAEGGNVQYVTMATHKPPAGLQNAPFVIEQQLDLSKLQEPLLLYSGAVTDAAKQFPANVNVAVALSLAGIGPDLTQYEIWADPTVERNTHHIKVSADETEFSISIAGVPSEENPATGKLTPLSTIATLRGLVSAVKVGT